MHRSTKTALGALLALAVLVGIGVFLARAWRGAKPALAPPPTPIGALFSPVTSAPPTPTVALGPPPEFPLKLPEGYTITLYAEGLKRPRVLILDPTGTPLASDLEAGTIVALPDDNQDGRADEPIPVLTNLEKPHGLAFRDGELFVAETDQVTRSTYNASTRAATDPRPLLELPGGGSHFTRTIGFGPDGMLHVSLGSSCNVCRERDDRRATILRVNPETGKSERWAWGLRNTVFFLFHPETGVMLGNDMGRDLLGDDLPPDELNVITGGDYGWPFCYGRQVPDPFGAHPEGCDRTEKSLFDYPAHVAPLGLRFIPTAFSEEFAGDLLVAFHGSWNRSTPIGYEVVRLRMDGDRVAGMEPFLTGFLGSDGRALGRPVDLLFLPDSSLLISDDHAGAVYRVVRSSPR